MYVQCVQSRNVKGRGKKKKKKANWRGATSVGLSGLSNGNREEMERNESCHFGHPSGLLLKGKMGPQREGDLFDS